jgi:cytochrome c oxidase assembly protein subunit 15
LKDEIGIFHACLAQAFLGMLVVIALATSPVWPAARLPNRFLAIFAIVISALIYAQLGLGATMRHQHRDLSITDFPLAYGQLIPATDAATIARINVAREAQAISEVSAAQIWLQMAHRLLAVIIFCGIVACRWFLRGSARPLRTLLDLWVVCVLFQITLGAWTIWSNKAADIATAHVAVGAITFSVGVALSAILLRSCGAPRRARQVMSLEEANTA